MKHCNNCRLDINTSEKLCPLCQSKLEGTCTPVFPELSDKKHEVLLKLILFLSIVSILVCGFIDYMNNNKFTFSYFVLLGVASFYIIIRYILKSVHKDILNVFFNVVVIVIVLLFIWFGVTKLSIIPSLVIPIITMVDLLMSSILAIILRNKYIRKYIHVILINCFLSLIPVILVVTKITSDLLIAKISFGCAIISIIGLIIFDFGSLKEELHKMFYI